MNCYLRIGSSQALPRERRAADRAITSVPPQPVVASSITHRPVPDLAHPSNTVKGSLGKRPIDIGDFIVEFEPCQGGRCPKTAPAPAWRPTPQ